MRARDLGIAIGEGRPGAGNAITDVAGVRVGHATLVSGDGPLVVGQGPVRTGVTVVVPHPGDVWREPLFAGCHTLNGNGELTGLEWVRESGRLSSVIALTNTHSLGVVRDALVAEAVEGRPSSPPFWALPVVGETWDGVLNDINGFHVRPEHVRQALDVASDERVAEGNVGGGTGMICHGFKGGIGTASRVLDETAGGHTVGVLVQANHGRRDRLRVDGVPIGRSIPATEVPLPFPPTPAPASGSGSVIVVVATDAPLLPHQCTRLAQRAGLGIGRTGGVGEHSSGDLFIAFATGNPPPPAGEPGAPPPTSLPVTMYSDSYITALFDAVVESTEEAILKALLAADTMGGRDGITAHGLGPDRLPEVLRRY